MYLVYHISNSKYVGSMSQYIKANFTAPETKSWMRENGSMEDTGYIEFRDHV